MSTVSSVNRSCCGRVEGALPSTQSNRFGITMRETGPGVQGRGDTVSQAEREGREEKLKGYREGQGGCQGGKNTLYETYQGIRRVLS